MHDRLPDAGQGQLLDKAPREERRELQEPEVARLQVRVRIVAPDEPTTPGEDVGMSPSTNTATKHSAAPDRSLTQRLDALERANEVRTKRAQLKRDLKGGRCSIHTLLMDPPAYVETAKVFDMLLAVPKNGRVKVNKVLTQCRISPSKTIGGLSQRQRDELVSFLRRPSGYVHPSTQHHALSPDGHGPRCPTKAARPRLTDDPTRVTCLTCANLLRGDVRARIAGAA